MDQESGQYKGLRKIQSEQHQVRTILYIAIMSAIQSCF
jgi:transposase